MKDNPKFPDWLRLAAITATSLLFLSGTFNLLSPAPVYLAIIRFVFGIPGLVLATFAAPLIYLVSDHKLMKPSVHRRKTQLAIVGTAIALNIAYFISSWKYGLAYQGASYLVTVTTINLVFCLVLSQLAYQAWKTNSTPHRRLTNFCLILFLNWYAFPYLGETP